MPQNFCLKKLFVFWKSKIRNHFKINNNLILTCISNAKTWLGDGDGPLEQEVEVKIFFRSLSIVSKQVSSLRNSPFSVKDQIYINQHYFNKNKKKNCFRKGKVTLKLSCCDMETPVKKDRNPFNINLIVILDKQK